MTGGGQDGAGKVTRLRPKAVCPTCSKPADKDVFPFCSERCRAVDLNRWLGGAYAIPAVEQEPPGDED